ncbi:MAG: metallophosphoesterase family protein, partial [Solirubrobacterales bacterium]
MTEAVTKPPETIRILHTADWHLGREFHGADLTDAHEAFFEWLLEQVTEQEIDVILMAGDIYDRAYPPARAVAQLNKWLDRLSSLIPIILISGNHDSAVRMGFGALLKDNITLRSGTTDLAEPVDLEPNGIKLKIYPVPYLDPG